MRLESLHVSKFRCFEEITLSFQRPVILIEGCNGAGKTALLEAIYFACFLRSFRCHAARELVMFGNNYLHVQLAMRDSDNIMHDLSIASVGARRSVKANGKVLRNHQELRSYATCVALTEDDMLLVKGGPEMRRVFIDHYIYVHEPDFAGQISAYDQAVAHRNALLRRGVRDKTVFDIWTRKLWEQARAIVEKRLAYIEQINRAVQAVIQKHAIDASIQLQYQTKKDLGNSFETFWAEHGTALVASEERVGHTLFGAHLDDIHIAFNGHAARMFASRGQQKLIVLLLKVAQACELIGLYGSCLFLLDDFMLDFDEWRLDLLIALLEKLNCQLFFTSAMAQESVLRRKLDVFSPQLITLPAAGGALTQSCQIVKTSILPQF